MKLEGRRESKNVDDRRGKATKTAGIGIGGLIIAGIIMLLTGRDPSALIQQANIGTVTEDTEYVATAEEQELAKFASQILAGTEDVWTAEFKKMGRTYKPPKLVLFKGAVQSGCGNATSSTGPFYCSADQCVYLDLEFFSSMYQQLGADGSRLSQAEANKISVRLELQADYYAGVWAYHDNKMFGSLEDGDIEEGLHVASVIGDDYLQKKARGYTVPESFNHGTSAQRAKWLKKGLSTGSVEGGDTFSPSYASL